MTGISREPARRSRRIAVAAGLLALASAGSYSWPALGIGAVGLTALGLGLIRGRHGRVTLGALGLFLGAIAAGATGAPVEAVLVAVTSAVIAWDVGGSAISVGSQLGREADTARLEAVHVAGSVGVGFAVAGVGYGLFRVAAGGQPVTALLFFLLSAVLLLEVLG